MALSASDMAALSRAISTGIQNGFATYFGPPPAPGSRRRRTPGGGGGGGGGGAAGGGGSPGFTPTPLPPGGSAAGVTAQANTTLSAAASIISSALNAHRVVIDQAAFDAENNIVKLRESLITTYGSGLKGVGDEAFLKGDFSAVTNEFARQQAELFVEIGDAFGRPEDNLLQRFFAFDKAELRRKFKPFIETLTNVNITAMKQLTDTSDTFAEESAMFSEGMGISMERTAQLLNVRFAETGEASTDILTQVTNFSKAIGDEVGMAPKDLADDTAKVVTNMERFTDIGVPSATRLAASLRQVGLSIPSFEGMIGAFETFQGAAGTAGDLSAMFGIQVDAIEMMYLANEDQEAFMQRMRQEVLAQGGDIEAMSGAQQRALQRMFGFQRMSELKSFMQTGIVMTETMGASQEAAGKTQEDALAAQLENLQQIPRTFSDLLDLAKDERFSQVAQGILQHSEAVGGYTTQVVNALDSQTALGDALAAQSQAMQTIKNTNIENALKIEVEGLKKVVSATEPLMRNFAKNIRDTAKNVNDEIQKLYNYIHQMFKTSSMPDIYEDIEIGTEFMINYLKNDAGPRIGTALDGGLDVMGSKIEDEASTRSMPKIFSSFEEGTSYLLDHLNKTQAEVAAVDFNIPVTPAPVIETPKFAAAEVLQMSNDEYIQMMSSINEDATAFDRAITGPLPPGPTGDFEENIETLKTAIIDAIKQGQAEIKHDLNVTLEMDKKVLAEILMSATTSDQRTFMTYTQ